MCVQWEAAFPSTTKTSVATSLISIYCIGSVSRRYPWYQGVCSGESKRKQRMDLKFTQAFVVQTCVGLAGKWLDWS